MTTIPHCAYELSSHPEIRSHLRKQDSLAEQDLESTGGLLGKMVDEHSDSLVQALRSIAGETTSAPFGTYFERLDPKEQSVVSEIIANYAASSRGAQYSLAAGTLTDELTPIMRTRLLTERENSDVNDPLGRDYIGYREDLSTEELWERGRGPWRCDPVRMLRSKILVITNPDDVVVMVGTISKVAMVNDRVLVEGDPLIHHPLIGGDDPLVNSSFNPVAWGEITTAVPVFK